MYVGLRKYCQHIRVTGKLYLKSFPRGISKFNTTTSIVNIVSHYLPAVKIEAAQFSNDAELKDKKHVLCRFRNDHLKYPVF